MDPEGKQLSLSTLKLAVKALNSKLRRRGQISAWELNTAHDQNTGYNLNLNDHLLRDQQLENRIDKKNKPSTTVINVGDTVRLRNTNDKHKAGDMYMVTRKDNNTKKWVCKKFSTRSARTKENS